MLIGRQQQQHPLITRRNHPLIKRLLIARRFQRLLLIDGSWLWLKRRTLMQRLVSLMRTSLIMNCQGFLNFSLIFSVPAPKMFSLCKRWTKICSQCRTTIEDRRVQLYVYVRNYVKLYVLVRNEERSKIVVCNNVYVRNYVQFCLRS